MGESNGKREREREGGEENRRETEQEREKKVRERPIAKGVVRARLERSFEDAAGCPAPWITCFRLTITSAPGPGYL